MSDYPHIFTFYSFKGGVGRSMAVLNLAYALAARGRNVLVLDMDLEAPGLSGFLHRHKEIERFPDRDMVDLIHWASEVPVPADENASPPGPLSGPAPAEFSVTIPRHKLEDIPRKFCDLGRLDVIPVEEGRDYYDRLTRLGMGNFDQEALVRTGSVLRAWLKGLRFPVEVPDYYGPDAERMGTYDYILVDSRTGISETGGLCIGPLSDQLVVLTALNDQNVKGTQRFLEEVGILEPPSTPPAAPQPPATGMVRRADAKPTHLVASLVPVGEIEMKRKRLGILEEALGKTVVALSYHPQMALLETIFTRDCRDENLAREYEILLGHILKAARDGEMEDPKKRIFTKFQPTPESRDALERLLRKTQVDQQDVYLRYHLNQFNPTKIIDDADFILWDRICRALSGGESSDRFSALDDWAKLLAEWGLRGKDTALAGLRFRESEIKYSMILQANGSSLTQKIRALLNRGVMYSKRGELGKAVDDYAAVLAMPDAPAEQRAKALVNRGVAYGRIGEPGKAVDDFAAVIAMPDAPAEPRAKALFNRGVAYGRIGEHLKAVDDYAAVIAMPDAPAEPRAKALVNRGVAYGRLGEPGKELDDYAAVLAMPDAPAEPRAKALFNRGVAYGRIGEPGKAVDDYAAVLAMPDAPAEQRAKALVNRGVTYGQIGEPGKAVDDYAAVLAMPDAPAEQRAKALANRAWKRYEANQIPEAVDDARNAISIRPDECRSHGNLAVILLVQGETADALSEYDTALALAEWAHVEEMTTDLREAMARGPGLKGADEAMARIEARREALEPKVPRNL